jgi:hypothetical protein
LLKANPANVVAPVLKNFRRDIVIIMSLIIFIVTKIVNNINIKNVLCKYLICK